MGGAGFDVLHVDDESDFAELTATFLERQDDRLSVRTALGAEEAVQALRSDASAFDVVVSDYQMSGMDGLELLETVRETHPDLPFILYTGKGSEEIASEAIAAGVTDYLQKEPGTAQYELLANRVVNAAEKYRADDRVRAQNRQYRRLFENAPVMYAVFRGEDGEPVIDDCNDRFLERLGYDRETVVGRSIRQFYAADSAARALDGFESARRGEFASEERTLVTADGDRVETLMRASPRVDEYGAVVGTVALYVDITERRTRERRLERLHAATREVFQSETPAAVAEAVAEAARETLDYPNNVVRLVDEEGERLRPVAVTDVARDEMGSRPDYPVEETPAGRAFREGEPVRVADVSQVDDGYDRGEAHAAMYHPIGDHGTISIADTDTGTFDRSDVELARILCTSAAAALDRIEWQEELEYQRALLESVTETGIDGVLVVDENREIVHHNDRFVELWDLPAEAIAGDDGRALSIILERVEEPEAVREQVEWLYENPRAESRDRVQLSDGRLLDCYSAPVAADARSRGRVWFFRDVTELARRERELERQHERLDAVVDILAHDLRNPLNVAEGHVELAREGDTAHHLDATRGALDRMETLVDDVLAWARQDGDEVQTEPVDLASVVERCWQNVSASDAALVVDAERTVRADRTLLRQLVENLVRNAVDHGAADGRTAGDGAAVTVRVGDLPDRDGFYVEDDGPGIPADERDRVFEPGYSTSSEGTGFGLSIVTTAAEAHGWKVDVGESDAGGARIEVTGVTTGEA